MTAARVIPLIDERDVRHPRDARDARDANASFDAPAQPARRTLVKWLAAATALSAAGCSRPPRERIYSYAKMPEIEVADAPLYYAGACLRAGYAEGVLIGTQQGRPIKVEGNSEHPASLGGSSTFAQAEVLQLWDPDRSTAPWARDGAGRATPSTWQAFESAWRAQPAGGAIHVLTPAFTSPTLAAQLARLLRERPGSRWYRDDAAPALAAARGAELAFGRALRPVHRFEHAELLVAVGGDPFSDQAAGVRQSADWARARAAATSAGRQPPRLVALETTPGLFGARADERWALAPPAIEAVLWGVAELVDAERNARGGAIASAEIGTEHGSDATPARQPDPAIDSIAQRLALLFRLHHGRVLLVGGEALSAESHALVHVLNQRLGAHEHAMALIASPDRHADVLPAPGTLAALAGAARSGAVDTLLILGSNPVYAAPASLNFAEALARVRFSICFGVHRDETAEHCHWHLPSGHAFEQWSDACAFDGSATLLQPAIAPLYDTRSVHELLEMLAPQRADAGGAVGGHELVRAYWMERRDGAGFEKFWTDSLRQGVVAGSAAAEVAVPAMVWPSSVEPASRSITAPASRVWAVFPPDPSIGDGEWANNGWLQELPRPFTELAWGNALLLGPRTAQRLHLASGDLAHLSVEGVAASTVTVPVLIQPAHAENAATLHSGHGRRAAGRIGNGVGIDNAALRSSDAVAVALRIEPAGGRHDFAIRQPEQDQHERELARVVPLPTSGSAARIAPSPSPASLYPSIAQEGPAWGMAIDLDACIGCNVCTVSCQAENNIPVVGPDEVRAGRTMHWIRVDAWHDDADRRISQPVPCMHCENAPCEVVCPVGATMHDSEGLNVQVYNRCIGTRFCSNNCPYKVRRFNYRQYSDIENETAKLMHNPDVTVRDRGVMEKCSYCVQRVSRARRLSQKNGAPLPTDSVQTACQSACPTRAIHFGDLHDPRSDVVRAKASPRHYAMLEELGTRPRTTYLARIEQRKDQA